MPTSPPRHNAHRVRENELAGQRDYNKRKRTGQGFYNSPQWKKTAARYKRNNPLCVDCEANGKTVAVDVVDHIIPVKEGGAEVDPDNLQSLCHFHHNKKTVSDRTKAVEKENIYKSPGQIKNKKRGIISGAQHVICL